MGLHVKESDRTRNIYGTASSNAIIVSY